MGEVLGDASKTCADVKSLYFQSPFEAVFPSTTFELCPAACDKRPDVCCSTCGCDLSLPRPPPPPPGFYCSSGQPGPAEDRQLQELLGTDDIECSDLELARDPPLGVTLEIDVCGLVCDFVPEMCCNACLCPSLDRKSVV